MGQLVWRKVRIWEGLEGVAGESSHSSLSSGSPPAMISMGLHQAAGSTGLYLSGSVSHWGCALRGRAGVEAPRWPRSLTSGQRIPIFCEGEVVLSHHALCFVSSLPCLPSQLLCLPTPPSVLLSSLGAAPLVEETAMLVCARATETAPFPSVPSQEKLWIWKTHRRSLRVSVLDVSIALAPPLEPSRQQCSKGWNKGARRNFEMLGLDEIWEA